MRSIGFLEELGRGTPLTDAAYVAAIAALGVDEAESESLLGRDASKLASLLGGRSRMWCAILTPEDAPAEDRPDDEPSHEEPEPGQQDPA